MLKQYLFQLGEAGKPIILMSTLLKGALRSNNLNASGSFQLSLLCSAAFMKGPSNMRAARGVSSYKYDYRYQKVVGFIFHSLILKIHINYFGALPQL